MQLKREITDCFCLLCSGPIFKDKTMLTTPVIHPTILEALGRSGHFAQVVIADGNRACIIHEATSTIGFALNT